MRVGHPGRGVPGVCHIGGNAAAQRIDLLGCFVVAARNGRRSGGDSGGSSGGLSGGGQHVGLHHAAVCVQAVEVHSQLGGQLRGHGAGLGAGHEGLHVLRHHSAIGAGPGNLGQIIALVLGQLAGVRSRQNEPAGRAVGGCGRRRGGDGSCCRSRSGRSPSWSGRRGSAGNSLAGSADPCDHGFARHRLALAEENFQQSSVGVTLHVVGQLISSHGEQHIARLDGVPLLLFPLFNGAFSHGQTHLRHQYFSCHI
ncbi:hypothetical protein SDC9_74152 [bioreactor metagenome]|uniref:Uncharacterized protein n=1 Tax=bioreactor metagenome TaxID=1076179 RepID=A0A644YH39_9ZZZZ